MGVSHLKIIKINYASRNQIIIIDIIPMTTNNCHWNFIAISIIAATTIAISINNGPFTQFSAGQFTRSAATGRQFIRSSFFWRQLVL